MKIMHKNLKKAFAKFEVADAHLNAMLKKHSGGFKFDDHLYALVLKMEADESKFHLSEIEFLKAVKRMLERSSAKIEFSLLEPHKFMAIRMAAKYEVC